MSQRKLRIGFVGTGGIALSAHVPGWQALPNVEIVAVADVREMAARQFVAATGGRVEVFKDYRDMMKLDLDAVDICTPNMVHTPAVLAALESGKHVLCEKPLATSTKDIRRMGKLADKLGLVLMSCQHMRWQPHSLALRDWIHNGGLGEVYHARVRAMRRAKLPPRPGFIYHNLSGGGPCMDIGVHALDAAMWMMDFPKPVRVSGTTKVNFAKKRRGSIPGQWGEWDRKGFDVEDFAAAFVHFENGATLMLETAWLGHQVEDEDMSFQLFGMRGGVKWPSAEFASVLGRTFTQGTLKTPETVGKAHTEAIAAFHQCMTMKKPSLVPWTETYRVIEILEAVYASQKKAKEIVIK